MLRHEEAPREGKSRRASSNRSLGREHAEGIPKPLKAQAFVERAAARRHLAAAVMSFGADRAGELALCAFYKRRADDLLWRAAA